MSKASYTIWSGVKGSKPIFVGKATDLASAYAITQSVKADYCKIFDKINHKCIFVKLNNAKTTTKKANATNVKPTTKKDAPKKDASSKAKQDTHQATLMEHNGTQIEFINGLWTLKAHTTVKPIKKSLTANLQALRDISTRELKSGVVKTTRVLTFTSLSSAASFIEGCSKNGNEYFKATK